MRCRLAPILFDDHDRAAAAAERPSIVAPAERSPAAQRKVAARRTDDGLPVHSFRSLLSDLATLCLNKVTLPSNQKYRFELPTKADTPPGPRRRIARCQPRGVVSTRPPSADFCESDQLLARFRNENFGLIVQHAPELCREIGVGERLEDNLEAWIEPPMMHDGIPGISGGVEHLELWLPP
jgi:hypothetical protein